MEDYEQYKTMGSVERVQMKSNCVPTRFDCQADGIQPTTSHEQPQFLVYAPNTQPVSNAQIPILLASPTEDSCHSSLPEDVTNTALLVPLFCVCCLARDVPFVRLVTCCHAEFLNNMIMPEIKPKKQVICYQCHNMLKKIKQFKSQVEESFKLLSDSSENIPKNSNQRLNYRTCQNFSMAIPGANRKKKPVKCKTQIPRTISIKPKIRYDHIKNEEKIGAEDKTEKSPTPKSSEKKNKQTKIIKEAFKIINNNQNSESINLLANSLQNLSSTLLDMIYPNINLGSQFDTALLAEVNISGNNALSSNITTSSTENITYVKEENSCIADSINIAVTPAISTENVTDVKVENAFQDDSINIAINSAISTENLTNIFRENAFETESTNTAINSSSPTENLNNKITEAFTTPTESKNRTDSTDIVTNPAMSTENLTMKKTEKSFGSSSINDYLKFTPAIPAGLGYVPINHTGTTNSTTSIELININKEDGSILGNEKDDRIICDTYVAGEELNQPVTEEEDSIGIDEPEKQESVGAGESNVQPVGTPIALDKRPILGGNIKQLTLTREQLMEERAMTAASPTYLRAPHKCESCIIGFQFYENLEDHFKRKHTRGKRLDILCDVCRQFVDYGASYDMHTFRHHTRYQCVACEQLFVSYDRAVLHYRKQHSTNKRHRNRVKKGVTFKCPRCPYKTGRKRLLRDHMSGCTSKQCGVSIGTIYCTGAPPEAKRAKLTATATETTDSKKKEESFRSLLRD